MPPGQVMDLKLCVQQNFMLLVRTAYERGNVQLVNQLELEDGQAENQDCL